MSAEPGSAEFDELELLTHLVEVFEDSRFPLATPSPLAAIRFRMDQQCLRPADLIPFLGSKGKVSEVLSGRRSLSLSMIRKLHQGLGIPAHMLLVEPAQTLDPALASLDWNRFPLAEMVKRNWFGAAVVSPNDLREQAEELLGPFLHPFITSAPAAMLRQKARKNASADEPALLVWKARVWQLAQGQRVSQYDQTALDETLLTDVMRLSGLTNGPLIARDFLAQVGIRLIVEPHMPRTYLDGAAIKLTGQAPLIALTLRHDRLDNFWFTLCHELAHVVLHLRGQESACFIDDLDIEDSAEPERVADELAARTLIPPEAWRRFRVAGPPSRAELLRFATMLRIHPAIVAGRLRKETGNYRLFTDVLGNGQVRSLFGSNL
jgi:HTH-type transcriptional regulator/antitoxin HigA